MTAIDFSLSSSDGFRQGEDFPTPALNGLWKAQFEVKACCQVLLGRTVGFSQEMGKWVRGAWNFMVLWLQASLKVTSQWAWNICHPYPSTALLGLGSVDQDRQCHRDLMTPALDLWVVLTFVPLLTPRAAGWTEGLGYAWQARAALSVQRKQQLSTYSSSDNRSRIRDPEWASPLWWRWVVLLASWRTLSLSVKWEEGWNKT